MQSPIVVRRAIAALATCAAVAALSAAAFAIQITVNGQPTTFNPPPIERAGRVFVPLRGVFESLGASVVYQNGVINATGNGRNISLTIGSLSATVNGQAQTLDVAPFIVGASTYVPLRFVSEALGAGVNYDATNQVVALTTSGQVAAAAPPPPAPAPVRELNDRQPTRDGSVLSGRPLISANFIQPVDPQSIHIVLDDRDVSGSATISPSGFVYAPQSPLQPILHTLAVTGNISNGPPFTEAWHFTTGRTAPLNTLTITTPPDGASVGQGFRIAGHTVPNARIHIVAGATATVGGVFAFGAGTYVGDLTADPSGFFSQTVTLQTVSGASIGVTVTSTDPASNEAAEKRLRLTAQ
jgi:Copper amine oxidase N-terminal domain